MAILFRTRIFAVASACLLSLAPRPSWAADEDFAPTYPVSLTIHDTLDLWRNTQGGLKVGDTQLNKLQVALAFDGDALGHADWKARLQYFRTNGERLSGGRVGDIQTASNIEALSTDRLMEAWIERALWKTGAVRVGLMDLNADFDSIAPAGLFLNSSHGIGPDLSQTGPNGPSIFPVSAFGVHGVWQASPSLTLRAAAFDGVPGDPDHPKAFAAVKLSRRDGALLIGQADWAISDDVQASFGAWRYTASFDRLDRPARQRGQGGAYAYVQGSIPGLKDWSGWVRAGFADPDIEVVGDYLGLGVVKSAPFPDRPDDQFGVAIAHAGIGGPARRSGDLPSAETTVELTYRYQVNDRLAVQPDVQYVIHPASQAGLENALVVGLRLNLTFKHPVDAPLD